VAGQHYEQDVRTVFFHSLRSSVNSKVVSRAQNHFLAALKVTKVNHWLWVPRSSCPTIFVQGCSKMQKSCFVPKVTLSGKLQF